MIATQCTGISKAADVVFGLKTTPYYFISLSTRANIILLTLYHEVCQEHSLDYVSLRHAAHARTRPAPATQSLFTCLLLSLFEHFHASQTTLSRNGQQPKAKRPLRLPAPKSPVCMYVAWRRRCLLLVTFPSAENVLGNAQSFSLEW